MIYKIYTPPYETIKFLYGLGKGHQQFILEARDDGTSNRDNL